MMDDVESAIEDVVNDLIFFFFKQRPAYRFRFIFLGPKIVKRAGFYLLWKHLTFLDC